MTSWRVPDLVVFTGRGAFWMTLVVILGTVGVLVDRLVLLKYTEIRL